MKDKTIKQVPCVCGSTCGKRGGKGGDEDEAIGLIGFIYIKDFK
jgi:hypothetical protein